MKITIEHDVAKVAEFMVGNLRAHDLHRVALAIADLADFIWKPDYIDNPRKPFRLIWAEDIATFESQQPSASTILPRDSGHGVSGHLDANDASKHLR